MSIWRLWRQQDNLFQTTMRIFAMQIKYGTYKVILTDDGIPDIDWCGYRAELGLSFKGTIAYKYKNLTINSSLWLILPIKAKDLI